MKKSNFHFGATSVMREVPPGQTAVIKFNGKLEEIDTEWGAKRRRSYQHGEGIGLARARWGRVPHRFEVELYAQRSGCAEIYGVQLG